MLDSRHVALFVYTDFFGYDVDFVSRMVVMVTMDMSLDPFLW